MYRYLLPAGTRLGDRYEIEEPIGAGGMGEVYRGRILSIAKPVAIKVLHLQHSRRDEEIHRFYREARTLARLNHPSFVDVIDVGEAESGSPYLVMELLTGLPLHDLLRYGPLDVPLVLRLLLDLLDPLEIAHSEGVIHRDLKPANLFIAQRGRLSLLKILDLGIAKVNDEAAAGLTASATAMGTALYMAPEQASSARDVDHRADLYAVGAIGFRLVTGRPHLPGESFLQVAGHLMNGQYERDARVYRPELPRWLGQLLASCLDQDPRRRPPSAGAMAERILERLGGEPPPLARALAMLPPQPAAEAQAPAPRVDGLTVLSEGALAVGEEPIPETQARREPPRRRGRRERLGPPSGRPPLKKILGIAGPLAALGLAALWLSLGSDAPRDAADAGLIAQGDLSPPAGTPAEGGADAAPEATAAPPSPRAPLDERVAGVHDDAPSTQGPAALSVEAERPPDPPQALAAARPEARATRPTGEMLLNSKPTGTVYLDGERIGETPLLKKDVPAGTHDVTIARRGAPHCTFTVSVQPGERSFTLANLDDDAQCGRR